jgi:hypothetical protein
LWRSDFRLASLHRIKMRKVQEQTKLHTSKPAKSKNLTDVGTEAERFNATGWHAKRNPTGKFHSDPKLSQTLLHIASRCSPWICFRKRASDSSRARPGCITLAQMTNKPGRACRTPVAEILCGR